MDRQQQIAAEFVRQNEIFQGRASELGLGDVSNYYWYHTIDLGNGLVTPGLYDFRASLPCFQFPEDMHGMRVLDVGSATGFFAFEFEKRGADVVSVELPSLDSLDRFPGQTTEQLIRKIEGMIVPRSMEGLGGIIKRFSAEELYFYLLDGPFEFCRKLLGSRVKRCFSSVYGVSAANTGGEPFDLVFMGDILLHTLNPLQALAAVAALCRGTLVLTQVIPDAPDGQAAMLYVGGDNPDADEVSWWWPNKPCLFQILKKLGFRTVEEIGTHGGTLQPSGYEFTRSIVYARK